METIQLGRSITMEVAEGLEIVFQDGKLKVRSKACDSKAVGTIGSKWGNHKKPPLYPGFTKIKGATWNGKKGPYALDKHGFPMVWIPVAILPDGLSRVSYDNSELSDEEYHEKVPEWRIQQIIADGGFYFPANPVSRNKDGKLQLCEGELPLYNISYDEAVIWLKVLDTKGIGYRPAYGVEYDCVCEWLKMNGYSMTDSTNWGNYCNTPKREEELALIGSRKEARTSIGLNDFGGTLWWITEEKNRRLYCAVRGGSCNCDGDDYPAGVRNCIIASTCYNRVGVWAVPFKKEQ